MNELSSVRRVLELAVGRRVFPGGVVEVGGVDGVHARISVGALTYDPESPSTTEATVYDLASLTKVLGTATAAMRLVDEGRLDLEATVASVNPRWASRDVSLGGADVTVADLLAHASGLPAHQPYFTYLSGRHSIEQAICAESLVYRPKTQSIYSDLGFMLLAFVLEDLTGSALDVLVSESLTRAVERGTLAGRPSPGGRPLALRFDCRGVDLASIAPTRFDAALGRCRQGDVDDDNARVLGSVAGHAGMFGTAEAVGWLAREVLGAWHGLPTFDTLASPGVIRVFATRAGTPGSSRALAWDTMLTTSSCGSHISSESFGHTGFTGTSLWIDPTAKIYVVFLTNRVHPEAKPDSGVQDVRRAVHDAVMEDCQTRRM
jgi:CubicO group peptidase (beta-lactamase class C family)